MLASVVSLVLAASPVADLSAQYLDGLFRARPHMATFMGVHKYDDRLVDLSDAANQKRVHELDALAKKLAAVDRSKLSDDDRADAQILSDGIALERLYLTDIREWTWNPRFDDSFPFYDPREIIATRLGELVHGEFAPEKQRLAWAKAQLRRLPKLLEQEQKALTNPSRVHLDQAVKDNQGRIEFCNTELKAFTAKDAAAEQARVAAVAALEKFQKFLVDFPREKATHEWRLGAELYAKKFPLALQTDMKPDDLVAKATEAFQQSRARLYAIARQLHHELWPKEPALPEQADPKAQAEIIRKVQKELTKDHPTAQNFVQAHADKLNALRAFIARKNLLELPPENSLVVLPMPEYKRGAAGAEYLSPGMLDTSSPWHGTYHVDPVDPSWPAEKIDSYLRANNDYEIELTSAHEAYPGHHTQAWYSRKSLNPLRATLWSGAFAEGWAVYGTTLLVKQGYGAAKNARYDFMDTRGAMIVAANAILDVKLQTGQMTDEQALRFMEDDGFQESALAEKKLLRAKLDSTQLCQYFIGYRELMDLERDVRARGPSAALRTGSFDQRAFDEAVIGHGTIGVKVLRPFVLRAR